MTEETRGRKKTPAKKLRQVVNLSCSPFVAKFLDKIQASGRNKSHFMLKAIEQTHELKDFLEKENTSLETLRAGIHKSFYKWELETDEEAEAKKWWGGRENVNFSV